MKEKQQEFQEGITKNTEQFSELLGSMGTTKNDMGRDIQSHRGEVDSM